MITMESLPGTQFRATSVSRQKGQNPNQGELRSVVLENGLIRIVVLPDLGAKIASLVRLATGREFLLQPAAPRQSIFAKATQFEQYAYGFDDCFPTVSECEYPDGAFRGAILPDHGELWSTPWKYQVKDNHLCLATDVRCLLCIFRKRVTLDFESVLLEYEVESITDRPFCYLWSAHPLLQIERGCKIILSPEVGRLHVGYATENRLATSTRFCGWRIACGPFDTGVDLSVIRTKTEHAAAKLFTPQLSDGVCAVHYPSTDESISYHFGSEQIPYVGIWICEGGWPVPGSEHFTAALEPCTGPYDSLSEAINHNRALQLMPLETKRWTLRVQVQHGFPPCAEQRVSR